MRRDRWGTAIALCVLARAAAAESVSWPAAVREALAGNPSLRSARAGVEEARAGVTVATAAFWPNLAADGGWNRGGGQPLDHWAAAGPATEAATYRFGGSAGWELFAGGGTLAARRRAVAALDQRRAAYAQASLKLRENLRDAYDRLAYVQRELDLLAAIKDRLHRDTRYLEIQYKSGREARWTFLKAQANEAGVDWQLAQARLDLLTARQRIAALLGRDPRAAGDIVAADDLSSPEPPSDIAPLYAAAETRHPDVAFSRAAVRAGEAALDEAGAGRWPVLSARASYDWSDGGAWPPARADWSAGLALTLPLFTGFQTTAKTEQARHAVEGERSDLDGALATVRSGLFSAWAAYRSDFDRQPSLTLDEDASAERFKTVQGLYEAGKAAYLDFEQAEGALTQAQQRSLSGKLETAAAAAGFAGASGLTLDDEGGAPR